MDAKIRINSSDIQGDFVTPPVNQGQIVEVSYACTEDYILEHCHDHSGGGPVITAYEWGEETFEPWDSAPKLGRKVGLVEIVES